MVEFTSDSDVEATEPVDRAVAGVPEPALEPRGFRVVVTQAADGRNALLVFPVEGYRPDADELCAREAMAPGALQLEFPSYGDFRQALVASERIKGILSVGFCAGKGYVWYSRPEAGSDRLPPELSVRQLMAGGCPVPAGAKGRETFRATQTQDRPEGVVRFNGTSCAVRIVRAARALDPDLCGDDIAQLLEACLR